MKLYLLIVIYLQFKMILKYQCWIPRNNIKSEKKGCSGIQKSRSTHLNYNDLFIIVLSGNSKKQSESWITGWQQNQR